MNVFIIAAITADGFIAETSNQPADWTGSADKKFFAEITKKAGVVVMGSRTFQTMGQPLPKRRNIVYTTKPETIKAAGVETTKEDPIELVKRLEKDGVTDLAICGGSHIYSLFMHSGVVTELYLTVTPRIFGAGVPIFSQHHARSLKLLASAPLDEDTFVLHYRVEKA